MVSGESKLLRASDGDSGGALMAFEVAFEMFRLDLRYHQSSL